MGSFSVDEENGNNTFVHGAPMHGVMEMSCFRHYDKVACIRCSMLTGLAFLTAMLCCGKLAKLHLAKHPSYHQYVIFYAAALECIIGGIQWTFWNVTQLDFLLHYIKLLQVLLMCHYYITLAIRAVRKEYWADKFMYPFLFAGVLYFTVIATFGIFNTESVFVECFAPYWLALSSAEVIVVQVFFVCGFYITRRLNEISTLDSVRWAQKRDLWCVVVVFELSALSTFIFDVILQMSGDRNTGCSAIFSHHQTVYSPLLVSLIVLKLLLPIWVMMLVFQPTTVTPTKDGEMVMPGYSDDGTYGSIFSEDLAYRQLYQPSDSFPYAVNATTADNSPPSSSCLCLPSTSCGPCMYDPALPFAYSNPTLPHSSSLQPILEEGGGGGDSLTSEQQVVDGTKKKKAKKVRKLKISKDPSTPKKKSKGKKTPKPEDSIKPEHV